jgi:hypothetical protein
VNDADAFSMGYLLVLTGLCTQLVEGGFSEVHIHYPA